MTKPTTCHLVLSVMLRRLTDPSQALKMIQYTLENDRLPPTLGSVKGFTRHLVRTDIEPDRISFTAEVPTDILKQVVDKMGIVSVAAFSAALAPNMFADESPDVITTIMVHDTLNRRVAVSRTTQLYDDAKDAMTTGVKMPILEAYFASDVSMDDPNGPDFQPWERGPKALLTALGEYIDVGEMTVH